MARDRKPRADAKIDGLGLTEEQRDMVYGHCERVRLADGVKWLKAEFDLEISEERLSKWLERERHERAFQKRLSAVCDASRRAQIIGSQVGSALQMSEAATAAFAAALLDAQIAEDAKGMKAAAVPLAMLLEAVAKSKKADADVSQTELAWKKFRYDAAEAALACVAELQEINRSPIADEEKRERAVKRLFGEKPSHVKTAAEVLG